MTTTMQLSANHRRVVRLCDNENLPQVSIELLEPEKIPRIRESLIKHGVTIEASAGGILSKILPAPAEHTRIRKLVFVTNADLGLPNGAKLYETTRRVTSEGFVKCALEVAVHLCIPMEIGKQVPHFPNLHEVEVLSLAVDGPDCINRFILSRVMQDGRATLKGSMGSNNVWRPGNSWFAVCRPW